MDTAMQFFPWRCAVSRQILAGHLPLWCSSIYAGVPLLANPQVAALYPPNWIFFLLPRAGIFTLLFALHIWLGALGVYYWLRARRFPHLSCLGAALLCEVCGTTWAHLAFGSYLPSMAIFPWALFFLENLRRRGGLGNALGFTVCAAFQNLAGAPQMAYYSFLIYIIWGVFQLVESRFSRRSLVALALAVTGILLGTALAGIQILPSLDFVRFTQRTGSLPLEVIERGSLHGKTILEAFLGSGDFPQDAGNVCYIGAAGVMILVLGIGASGKRGRLRDIALLVFVLVLGTAPFSGALSYILPGYGGFHDPRRILAVACLAGAPLLARGFTTLLVKKGISMLGRMILVALALVTCFFLWRPRDLNVQLWPALGWIPNLPLLGSIVLSVLLFLGILFSDYLTCKKKKLWLPLLILFTSIEILNYSFCRVDTKAAPERIFRPRMCESLRTSIQDNYFPRIFAFDPPGHYSYHYTRSGLAETWLPNLAATAGVSDFQGYDPLKPERFDLFLHIMNEGYRPLYRSHFGLVRDIDSPLLKRAGVTHAVGLPRGETAETWKRVEDVDAPETGLFEHTARPSRFAFETNPEFAANLKQAMKKLRAQNFSASFRGVIEEGGKSNIPGDDANGEARIEVKQYREGFARLELSVESGGYLFFRESWFPGWRVFVDEKERENLHADVMFQAVRISPGTHTVTWKYRPASLGSGLKLTIAAFIVTILLFLVGKRMWKSRRRHDPTKLAV